MAGERDSSLFPKRPDWLWAHPPSHSMAILGFVPRAEVADVRSDLLSPSTTDIKNECSYTSIPLFAFMT